MFKKIKNNIPNAITCCNLMFGVAAIIAASTVDEQWCGKPTYIWAYIFIALAALADFLDGFMARVLSAYSSLGKELDSLCDLVSFGVAPAIILYHTIIDNGGADWSAWCSLLIPACGALRLARFNVDDLQTTTFTGLPIPANALFWIGFTSFCMATNQFSVFIVLPAILLMSWLMISPLKMYSLKFHDWTLRNNARRYLLIFAAVLFVATSGLQGFMWLIVYYIVSSIGLNMNKRID